MKAEIVTYTGKLFNIFDPKPELICIEDIAHSLANTCRFTGHTRKFYSVAEHSVRMALSHELKGHPMTRLLHDAAEAYFGDIATPLKRKTYVSDGNTFRPIYAVEAKILVAISEALGVDLKNDPVIKEGDKRMALTEIRDLMPKTDAWAGWYKKYEPLKERIDPWTPARAEVEFLMAYNDLASEEQKLLLVETLKLKPEELQ